MGGWGGVSRSRYLLGVVLVSKLAACAGGADGRRERGLNLYVLSVYTFSLGRHACTWVVAEGQISRSDVLRSGLDKFVVQGVCAMAEWLSSKGRSLCVCCECNVCIYLGYLCMLYM